MVREYLTEAVVLNQDYLNDLDVRVDLYTKDFGRLKAKARSLKKTTSKLAGHLEPLTLSRVRLVEKNGLSVTDALTITRFDKSQESLQLLGFFRENVLEGEPDLALWQWLKDALSTGMISYDSLSQRLGLS